MLLLMVAACTRAPTLHEAPPILPQTTTTTIIPSDGEDRPEMVVVHGALPDGTPYELTAARISPVPTDISAAIVVSLPEGERFVGAPRFIQSAGETSFKEQSLQFGAGDWTVRLDLDQEVIEAVGVQGVADAVHPTTRFRLPVLVLDPPFRWAANEEVPLHMEVTHGDLVVRVGCSDLAVACSADGEIQAIPVARVVSGEPAWDGRPVRIRILAGRPVSDPAYLDPGVAHSEHRPELVWTGDELVVWASLGIGDDPGPLGWALDPDTSRWRRIADAPFDGPTASSAAWWGDRMVVVSPEATMAYLPAQDRWEGVGPGIEVPSHRGFLVATVKSLYLWNRTGIWELDPVSGSWQQLPHPGFGEAETFNGALRVVGGDLYVVGMAPEYCTGRRFARWSGVTWEQLPDLNLAGEVDADCSWANQTASLGGRLLAWHQEGHPTVAYDPAEGLWEWIAPIPLGGTEGPPSPLQMGELLLVPQYGVAALYYGRADRWMMVELPGWAAGGDMVWTGTEVLAWTNFPDSSWGNVDAWRWTPPG